MSLAGRPADVTFFKNQEYVSKFQDSKTTFKQYFTCIGCPNMFKLVN